MIEACIGVIGVCLPCMAPLFGARSVKSMVESIRSKVSQASLPREGRLAQKGDPSRQHGWSSDDEGMASPLHEKSSRAHVQHAESAA